MPTPRTGSGMLDEAAGLCAGLLIPSPTFSPRLPTSLPSSGPWLQGGDGPAARAQLASRGLGERFVWAASPPHKCTHGSGVYGQIHQLQQESLQQPGPAEQVVALRGGSWRQQLAPRPVTMRHMALMVSSGEPSLLCLLLASHHLWS